MQHYYHARYPTDDWHLACMFSLVYFSVEVCLVGVLSHSVSIWSDPCVRACAPLMNRRPPLTRKQYRTRGGPVLPLSQARGHLNWRTGLPALLGGGLGWWILLSPPYIAQFLGYVMGRIHMALRSYSVLDILLPPIIIFIQECSQSLKTCKRL